MFSASTVSVQIARDGSAVGTVRIVIVVIVIVKHD
jgi:hypothetical protein